MILGTVSSQSAFVRTGRASYPADRTVIPAPKVAPRGGYRSASHQSTRSVSERRTCEAPWTELDGVSLARDTFGLSRSAGSVINLQTPPHLNRLVKRATPTSLDESCAYPVNPPLPWSW